MALLLCSLPAFSKSIFKILQVDAPIEPNELKQKVAGAEAVVLLAGGRRMLAEEYGDDTVNLLSLERARYAAWILKRTDLPLIISGGRVSNETRSEADLIRQLLQDEFNIEDECYIEEKSRTTYQNAKFTSEFLKKNNIQTVALITHAWHMQRAKFAFEHLGIQVIPAPTMFYGRHLSYHANGFLPSLSALKFSELAFHEILGQIWYRIRYY